MDMINSSKLKILTFGTAVIMLAVFLPIFANAENLSVSAIEVVNIADNSATIKWRTPEAKTSGIVYVGESENKFERSFRCDSYLYDHEVTVGNLQKNKTYFYKIIIADREGEKKELFIRSFSTKAMADTRSPEIIDLEVVSSSYGAVMLRWTTNEDTSAKIYYGTSADSLNRNKSVGSMSKEKEIVLTNLESGTRYYMKVAVRDRDGNESSRNATAFVSGRKEDAALGIYDISPVSFEGSGISARKANISFRTNLPAKSRIRYGTSLKSMTGKADVSEMHDFRHSVQIAELKPLTTYFFRIEAYDGLYNLRSYSETLSFETGDFVVRYPSSSLVRPIGDLKVYLIYKDTKAWIENPAVFLGLGFKGGWIKDVPAHTLEEYEEIRSIDDSRKHPNGSLIKYEDSPTVYFIDGSVKRPIANPEAFVRNGFSWDRIVNVSIKKERYVTGEYIN